MAVDNPYAPRLTRLKLRMIEWPGPQYMFAEAVDISPQHFSEYMMGRRQLPLTKAVRIAYLLECTPTEVMGWADEDDMPVLDGVIR